MVSDVNIIIFGPPGAGKGTQAYNLAKKFNYYQISTGDLLRKEIENKTQIGNKIISKMDTGELVTDNIVNDLLYCVISESSYKNKLIFDGYPRTIEQALNLDILLKKNNQTLGAVIFLNTPKEIIIKRIEGRVSCEICNQSFNKYFDKEDIKHHKCGSTNIIKRSDDNLDTILKR